MSAPPRSSLLRQRMALVAVCLTLLVGTSGTVVLTSCTDAEIEIATQRANDAVTSAKEFAQLVLQRGCVKPLDITVMEDLVNGVDKAASDPRLPKSLRTDLSTASNELHTLLAEMRSLPRCE